MEVHQPTHRSRLWLAALALFLAFAAGIVIGRAWQVRSAIVTDTGAVDIVRVMDLYGATRTDAVAFEQFWTIWDKIKEKYVDQPVDEVELFYGALQGVVKGLEDPYSLYFPPKKAKEFAKDLSGAFEGIGAEIGIRDGQLVIIAPLPSSPAEQAGIKPGDKIFRIDDEDTIGMTIAEAVLKIRGERGSIVTLTVTQNGFDSLREVSVVRDTITVPTVDWEMKEDAIAYVRISYFNQDTWQEFDKAIRELLRQSADGVVLDLRSNPGGFLETSIAVASEWVPYGPIVREKGRDDNETVHSTVGSHRLTDMPTVVLVDGASASASEIVAGALQDYDAATVVGQKTFGKGSVQDFEVFPDGSALKLTIARWFTPKEQQIDQEGIAPDIVIEEMFVETDDSDDVIDIGLQEAIKLLTS